MEWDGENRCDTFLLLVPQCLVVVTQSTYCDGSELVLHISKNLLGITMWNGNANGFAYHHNRLYTVACDVLSFFPTFFMLFLVAMLPYMHTLSSGNPMQWQIPCLFIDNLWFCIRMPHRLPTPLIPFSMGQNFRIYFAFSAFGVTFRCNHIRSIQKWVHWT